MYKQKLIAVSILIGSGIIPCISSAETSAPSSTTSTTTAPTTSSTTAPTTPADSTSSMTKEAWLNTISPMLPSLICKGFMGDPELKQRLDSIKMTYDQCVSSVPESVSKCQAQLSPNIPNKITNEDAATWGKSLGECIGKDFATKYLIPK